MRLVRTETFLDADTDQTVSVLPDHDGSDFVVVDRTNIAPDDRGTFRDRTGHVRDPGRALMAGPGTPLATIDLATVICHTEDPREPIKAALRRGYEFVWIKDVVDAMHGGPLPARPVMLTYDDNRAEVYTVAKAVVEEYGVKANCFITSDFAYGRPVDQSLEQHAPGTQWGQIVELHDSGLWDWGNHTTTHVNLRNASAAEREAEIGQCNEAIRAELGIFPRGVAYPWGAHSPAVIAAARAAGLSAGWDFATSSRVEWPSPLPSAPFSLNRTGLRDDPLRFARDDVLYHWAHDTSGERNDGNQLDYWTMPPGGSLQSSGSLQYVRIDGAQSASEQALVTRDLFRVRRRSSLLFKGNTRSWNHGAGDVAVRILQYDRNRDPLPPIGVVAYGEGHDNQRFDVEVDLADGCRWVRLEMWASGTFDGTFDLVYGWLRVAP